MKKILNDFFDNISAKELDAILGDGFADEPVNPVALKRLEAKIVGKKNIRRKVMTKRIASAIAACLAIAICAGAGVGGYAFSVEAAEYKAATEFFDEYNLSTEGLTRAEVKDVYRDITSQTFSYSSTAEVIKNSVYEGDIEGYAISADSPESIAEFWSNNMEYSEQNGEKVELTISDELGVKPFELIKYKDNSEEWRVTFDVMQGPTKWSNLDDGYAVYGRSLGVWDKTLLAYVENDGQVRYIKSYDLIQKNAYEDKHTEDITAIFKNDDGTLTIISNATNIRLFKNPGIASYLNIAVIDAEGNVISSKTTEIDWAVIREVTRVADGYLLQVTHDSGDNRNVILKIDREGNYVTCFEFNELESIHKVTDITEVNSNVYISCYVVPEITDDFAFCGNDMSKDTKTNLTDSQIDISDEELITKAKGNYTAMLLVCDSEDGKVKEFYSVDGAVGANINVSDNGEIVWDVKNIVEVDIRNYYEKYEMSAVCSISRYLIGGNGEVSSIEDTNKFSRHSNTYHRFYNDKEFREIFEERYGITFEEYKETFKERCGMSYEEYKEVAKTASISESLINFIKSHK